MTREDLEGLNPKQLRKTADNLGVKYHPRAGDAKVVDAILAAVEGQQSEEVADEGDIVPETVDTEATQDVEGDGPTVDQLLSGDLDHAPAAPERVVAATQTFRPDVIPVPAKPSVVLSAVPDENKKNKLEEVINKEITEWPTVEQAHAALQSHVARGLNIVALTDEAWHFRIHNREASGNLKTPLRVILQQASLLLQPTGRPTEGDDIEEILRRKMPKG
jgi:hypothetical protein